MARTEKNSAKMWPLLAWDLIQLITGMIFEGPQIVGEINRGLAAEGNIS